MEQRKLKVSEVLPNEGQIPGLPTNPRQWKRSELDNLKKSIQETPELFEARGILVVPYGGKYIVLGGNMRLAAARSLGLKEVPCIILPEDTPIDKLKEIVIKDNGSFGEWDYDLLANEWDDLPLAGWGVPAWETKQEDDSEVAEDDFDEDSVKESRVKLGDLYQRGDHLLLCGDSTKEENVKRIMGGGRCRLVAYGSSLQCVIRREDKREINDQE